MSAEHAASQTTIEWLLHSNVFNVLMVLAFLAFVINKFKLFSSVGRQQATIAQQLAQAEEKRTQAEQQLLQLQSRISAIDTEAEGILEQARTAANTLQAKLIANAQQEAERLIEAAKQRVVLEEKAALERVKSEHIKAAVAEARAQLMNTQTETQAVALKGFVQQLNQVNLASVR
ncbi:MAG: ATP synthase F0 subunit B [Vampirovibrionales bacterium]|nr:ATP synthase F0 subunit B [Vampirovibrionales bacterium]